MRIRPNELIAGYPALAVRALLRGWPDHDGQIEYVAREMGLRKPAAKQMIADLAELGFLNDAPERPRGLGRFAPTIKGAALAQAKASAPVHRSTAERKLRELVTRMMHVNENDEFIVGIEQAFVYGSYLSAIDRLGDLDVSLTFYRKNPGDDFVEQCRRAARRSGRHFGSYFDELFWPEKQVLLYLKQRSRTYSLHQDERLLQDPAVPRRAIFLQRKPVP
jgi:hypothetical protein